MVDAALCQHLASSIRILNTFGAEALNSQQSAQNLRALSCRTESVTTNNVKNIENNVAK
jgi:hypothetical protein